MPRIWPAGGGSRGQRPAATMALTWLTRLSPTSCSRIILGSAWEAIAQGGLERGAEQRSIERALEAYPIARAQVPLFDLAVDRAPAVLGQVDAQRGHVVLHQAVEVVDDHVGAGVADGVVAAAGLVVMRDEAKQLPRKGALLQPGPFQALEHVDVLAAPALEYLVIPADPRDVAASHDE